MSAEMHLATYCFYFILFFILSSSPFTFYDVNINYFLENVQPDK